MKIYPVRHTQVVKVVSLVFVEAEDEEAALDEVAQDMFDGLLDVDYVIRKHPAYIVETLQVERDSRIPEELEITT